MISHINPDDPKIVQTVPEHLEGTAKLAERMGVDLGMGCLAYITGLYHDLGKWRVRFERYIKASVSGESGASRGSVNHSSAGAIYIYQKYYNGSLSQKLTAQLISEAILSHHGVNDCMSAHGEDCFRRRVENLEGLDYEEVMSHLADSSISEELTDEYFKKAIKEVENLEMRISDYGLSPSYTPGLIERMLMSVLIDADRLDTAFFCGDRELEDLEFYEPQWYAFAENLENRLDRFPKASQGIFSVRRKIAEECLKFADRPSGIYRLTVPTGGAKTLSSMRYGIKHAQKYGKKRIFYIGPYLSILEQNSQVFKEALGNEKLILEHHSNVIIEEGKEEFCGNSYRHLTENWDTALIITTFVQFLNTLFDSRTSSIRRFHNLANSVIIIDEIQSLPIKMIHMFNMAVNYLHYMCGSTIVLCSATQPVLEKVRNPLKISAPGDMIGDVTELYKQMRRVIIEERKGRLTTEALCGFVNTNLGIHKDILVILNTKKAVEQVYRGLLEYYGEKEDPITLIHLSTSMCPEHRLSCISQIKTRNKNDRIVCVSTSLIEAGVDISFSCVIRSYAGLDSIAQAAGRCNRNEERKEGIVYLIHYDEERLGNLEQIRKGAVCSEAVVALFDKQGEQFGRDLLSPLALNAFYERYYYDPEQRRLMNYPSIKHNTNLVDLLSGNYAGKKAYSEKYRRKSLPDLVLYQAFKTAGDEFTVLEQDTVGVLVPFGEGEHIIEMLNGKKMGGRMLREWLRRGQRFTVSLYQDQLERLNSAGAIIRLNNGQILALENGFYDDKIGVVQDGIRKFLEV